MRHRFIDRPSFMLAVLFVAAIVAPCVTGGCATGGDRVIMAVGWGSIIALDINALKDGGSTEVERAALRRDVADAAIDLSDNDPTVKALAEVLATKGKLTPEEERDLLAAIESPELKSLVSMTIEYGRTTDFKEADWRQAVRALARWAAKRGQTAPPPAPTPNP